MGVQQRASQTSTSNDEKVKFSSVKRGEAGRSGFHPERFFVILWRNSSPVASCLMLLWVFVPTAIVLAYVRKDLHRWIFALSYIAIVPCASTLDFAGQELARKLPRVAGIIVETILSTVVEMILFVILISKQQGSGHLITVIKAAILGSVLANMLLCLGICLFVGGVKFKEQTFHTMVGQTSSDVLMVAGFALVLPGAFFTALYSSATSPEASYSLSLLRAETLSISRGTAIILMTSFFVYLFHNISSHGTLFDKVLQSEEGLEESGTFDQFKQKPRLTFSECCMAIAVSLAGVCILAYILVREIEPIVSSSTISENFMGLIIVPLVEKVAEHVTAVNKVLKDQTNMAIFHCVGPSIQTALFNTPLIVIIGWAMNKPMDLNFEAFQLVSLILAIFVVVNFLREGTSNYLKGFFLVIVYCIVGVGAWYYPSITVSSHG